MQKFEFLFLETEGCKNTVITHLYFIHLSFRFEREEMQFYFDDSIASEFKGKQEIGHNSAAEFDTKFINIAKLFTKSNKTFSGIRFR